jgi:hypothetical protein
MESMEDYIGNFTPVGAKVVRANASGCSEVKGWAFYYNGWEYSAFNYTTFARGAAIKENWKSDI